MSLPRPDKLRLDVEYTLEPGLHASWDEPRIGTLVHSILDREFPEGGAYAITLHLVGDEAIRSLNAKHRGIDAHTDVLSFPLQEPNGTPFVLPPGQPTNLGDVVVSHPTAVAQAHEFGHSVDRELAYLVAHGVLHVLGYDHEAVEDQRRMRQREEEALRPLGFTR